MYCFISAPKFYKKIKLISTKVFSNTLKILFVLTGQQLKCFSDSYRICKGCHKILNWTVLFADIAGEGG